MFGIMFVRNGELSSAVASDPIDALELSALLISQGCEILESDMIALIPVSQLPELIGA